MNALIPLHFEAANIRMVILNGVPWWVGIDVTAALGIVKAHQALAGLSDYERGTYSIGTPSGDQEMIIINESGFYSLLFKSRKPVAAQFKRWLTCEVLPSIRKHGSYPPPPAIDTTALPAPQAIEAHHQSSVGSRFIEEAERVAATLDVKANDMLSIIMSKAAITTLRECGTGVQKVMKDEQKLQSLVGAGFDLRYILLGQRTQTREERDLITAIRNLEPPQRALAFQNLNGLLGRLSAQQELEHGI